MVNIPRFVVAAPASSHGKTTVATGLMAALTAAGNQVAPFKVGPDYIDPGYHGLAAGRPGRNLDPFLCGEERVAPLLVHGAYGADLAIIEGAMGLFDGQLGTKGFASTAHVARLIDAPVILVVDVRHTSRSIGALVHGMAHFDPEVTIAGVILNQVGSARHEAEVRDAVAEVAIPVLGALPRKLQIEAPSRHLGLVPAAERDDAGIKAMGETVAQHLDLAAVLAVAGSAPELAAKPWDPSAEVNPPSARRPVVAVAGGRAFTFRYPETDELLRAAGCEPVVFDPLHDTQLPPGTAGLWLGGGFPEVHALELTDNSALRSELRAAISAGLPTVAECAGLLYLCRELDGKPMVGALPATSAMTGKLTMGYRTATARQNNLLGRVGEEITGHEFHRTQAPAGAQPAWEFAGKSDGVATKSLHASYLHIHWAGHPQLAQRFSEAVHAYSPKPVVAAAPVEVSAPAPIEPDLEHHGDQDLAPGLVDFAVNVRQSATPHWLVQAIREPGNWASYPEVGPAIEAIASFHHVPLDWVLPVAGAAEAFTLIARGLSGDAVVVHPQFTEPESALRAAGRNPARHILRRDAGFRLFGVEVPVSDLAIVGNPTNPTGVLHPRTELLKIRTKNLIVDEAFMDTIAGEPESLIDPNGMAGRVVLRSLTKTWAIAGIRVGYAIGDPKLIRLLRAQQPPWSVSTPAIAAIRAVLKPERVEESRELALAGLLARSDLAARLGAIGLHPVPGAAPFVLVDTSSISPTSLRSVLAEYGFAVRRGESFPGLGRTWLRLAARAEQQHLGLVAALEELKGAPCKRNY